MAVDPEFLALVAGVVLSLAFSYVPGLQQRYQRLTGEWKRLVMAGLLLAVAMSLYALGCAGLVAGGSCSREGLVQLMRVFVLALMANQSTYTLVGSQFRGQVYDYDLPEM